MGLPGVITTWDVGRTLEKLVNHSPSARDLQAFSRVLPTSRVGYHTGKPIESVVYCLNIFHLECNRFLNAHSILPANSHAC